MNSQTSFSQPDASAEGKRTGSFAPEILISLATAPVLALLVGGKALIEGVREVGVWSEEIFRGDRLPLLNSPVESNSSPDDSSSA